ncbi:MAG: flagellar biosynthesis anti-sigma factor FlgM [bacterium]
MVVNPITLTPKVTEVNGVKPKGIENDPALADKVSISSQARGIQQERVEAKELAKKIMVAIPDIRQEKISEVIERLNSHSLTKEEIIEGVAERMARMIGIGLS